MEIVGESWFSLQCDLNVAYTLSVYSKPYSMVLCESTRTDISLIRKFRDFLKGAFIRNITKVYNCENKIVTWHLNSEFFRVIVGIRICCFH